MADGSIKPALNQHTATVHQHQTVAAHPSRAGLAGNGSTSSMSSLITPSSAAATAAGFPGSAGFSYFGGPTPSSSAATPSALMGKINPWSAAAAAAGAGPLYSAPATSYSYWAGSAATTPVTGAPLTAPQHYPYPPAGYAAYGLPTASASLSDLTSGLYPMSTASVSTAQGSTPTGLTRAHSAGISSLHSKSSSAVTSLIKSSALAAMRNSSGSSSSANTATGSSLYPTPSGLIQKSGLATTGLVPPPGSTARTPSDMTTTTSQPDGDFGLFGGSTPLDPSDPSRYDHIINEAQRRGMEYLRAPSDSPTTTDRAFAEYYGHHRDQYSDYVGGVTAAVAPSSSSAAAAAAATASLVSKHPIHRSGDPPTHHFDHPTPTRSHHFDSSFAAVEHRPRGDSQSHRRNAYAHRGAVSVEEYMSHDYPRYLDDPRYRRGPIKPPVISKVSTVTTAPAPIRSRVMTAASSSASSAGAAHSTTTIHGRPMERVSVSTSTKAVAMPTKRVMPSSYAAITGTGKESVDSHHKYASYAATTAGSSISSKKKSSVSTSGATSISVSYQAGNGAAATSITSSGLNEKVIKEISEKYASKRVGSFNPKTWPKRPRMARFYVIKSYGEDDVHKSIKYQLWASTKRGNVTLQKGWERAEKSIDRCLCADSTDPENGCPIYLFFSVNRSRCFCGMAQLMSGHDKNQSFQTWVHSDKWKGTFRVDWIFVKDIPNKDLQDIRLPNNEFKPVTFSRDTQEIPFTQGLEMLRRFVEYKPRTIILQDFDYYNQREKDLKDEREKERAEREKARKLERIRDESSVNSYRHEYGTPSRGSPESGASLSRAAIGYYDDPSYDEEERRPVYSEYSRGGGGRSRGRDRATRPGRSGRNGRGRGRSGRSGGRSDSSYGSPGAPHSRRRSGSSRDATHDDGGYQNHSRRDWGQLRSKMHDRSVATARANADCDVILKKIRSKHSSSSSAAGTGGSGTSTATSSSSAVTPVKKQVWQKKSPVSSQRTTDDSSDRRPPTTETDIDSCPSEVQSAASPRGKLVVCDEDTKEIITDRSVTSVSSHI